MTRQRLTDQAAEHLRSTGHWSAIPDGIQKVLAVEAATVAVDAVLTELGITAPTRDNCRPRRIQRHSTRGWTIPDGAEYVGRPKKWGNPFLVGTAVPVSAIGGERILVTATDATHAVELFEKWLAGTLVLPPETRMSRPPTRDQIRHELAGLDLVCWCPLADGRGRPVPCHADVLLDIANDGGTR